MGPMFYLVQCEEAAGGGVFWAGSEIRSSLLANPQIGPRLLAEGGGGSSAKTA